MHDLLPILVGVVFLIGIFVLAWLGLRLIARDTARKGKWGFNRKIVFCPDCGLQMPKFRTPHSLRQALWGGWTCRDCGCEMDKWGQKIESREISRIKSV
jgi:hypothetical protein